MNFDHSHIVQSFKALLLNDFRAQKSTKRQGVSPQQLQFNRMRFLTERWRFERRPGSWSNTQGLLSKIKTSCKKVLNPRLCRNPRFSSHTRLFSLQSGINTFVCGQGYPVMGYYLIMKHGILL